MKATVTRAASTRKASPAKKAANDPLAGYSLWVRKLNKLAAPLRGKLTKAIGAE